MKYKLLFSLITLGASVASLDACYTNRFRQPLRRDILAARIAQRYHVQRVQMARQAALARRAHLARQAELARRAQLARRHRIILAHRVINNPSRIIVGYKIEPNRVTTKIHLPARNPSLFARRPCKFIMGGTNPAGNSFSAKVLYGGDTIDFTVKNRSLTIVDRDFRGKLHRINSTLPPVFSSLMGRLDLLARTKVIGRGNTIEISTPRR